MSKVFGRSLVVLAFCWTGSVSAAHITVDGREWLQPIDFINLSWNDVSQICDPLSGACSGVLGTTNVDGYSWANVDDMNILFNYYLCCLGAYPTLGPGPDLYAEQDSDWAPAFFADGWQPTAVTMSGPSLPLNTSAYGWMRETVFDEYGRLNVRYGDITDWNNAIALQEDIASTYGTVYPNDTVNPDIGAWLYRNVPEQPSPAPIPATLPLLGLGLATLIYIRRKR
jgi:hypothetical protein